MNTKNRRLPRLLRECNASAVPACLLAASCAGIALWAALQAPPGNSTGTQSAEPAVQEPASAA